MAAQEFGRGWSQRGDELGEMNAIRKASIFPASAEESFPFKEIPCLVIVSRWSTQFEIE